MFQPAEESRAREALAPLQLARLRATLARIAAHNAAYWRHLGHVDGRDLLWWGARTRRALGRLAAQLG